jgi:hypothetical protein
MCLITEDIVRGTQHRCRRLRELTGHCIYFTLCRGNGELSNADKNRRRFICHEDNCQRSTMRTDGSGCEGLKVNRVGYLTALCESNRKAVQ